MKTSLQRYDYVIQRLISEAMYPSAPGHSLGFWREVAKPGDLVWLQAAPPSDWHLSFLVEQKGLGFDTEFLLESLRTGELCKWSNVSVVPLKPEFLEGLPRVRWFDDQFEFAKKFAAEVKRADCYPVIPFISSLSAEELVIGTRTRHAFDSVHTASPPIKWRELSRGELRTCISRQIRVHNHLSKAKRVVG